MRRTGTHRLRALALVSTLVIGGFGLPLLDTLCFHSAPAVTTVPPSDSLLSHRGSGVAHLFGCAVLTSAVSGRGLPSLSAPSLVSAVQHRESRVPFRPTLLTQTDLTLSQSRAPPGA